MLPGDARLTRHMRSPEEGGWDDKTFLTLVIAASAVGNLPALAASRSNPIDLFDTDSNGTLDLAEVKKAASFMFAKLDRDHDGTRPT